MKFILCIPAYNEEYVIVETLRTISSSLNNLSSDISWEIIVADNGSTDSTKEVVEKENIPNVKVISIEDKGKGLAIRTIALKFDADFFGFIDADLSADPKFISPMLEVLKKGNVDVVVGSRLIDTKTIHRGFFRTASSRIFNFFQYFILGLNIKDTQCGLKLMNRNGLVLLRKCLEDSWFLDMEFLSLAVRDNLKILEMPISWEEFRYPNRKAKLKVIRDSLPAIASMFRIKSRLNKKYEKRSF